MSMAAMAKFLLAMHRPAEALVLIDECLERVPGKAVDPRMVRAMIELRVRYFAMAKDVAGCRETAEVWEKLNYTDAESYYIAANVRAVTCTVAGQTPGADATRLAEAEAGQAMDWLRKAMTGGYGNISHLVANADLAPLRKRADYAALLWDLADTPAAAQ